MEDNKYNLNSKEMTKVMQDVYMPALTTETWNNAGALSEAFGLMNIGKKVNAASGKLDVYIKKGKHGSVGALGDDYTFDGAVQKPSGEEMVVRTRGFQANARIDIVPNNRMQAAGLENIFADQFDELGQSLKKNYARMLYGDGSGLITTVSVKGGGTVGTYTLGANEIQVDDVRSFEIGDIITSVASATVGAAGAAVQKAGINYNETNEVVESKNAWATHGAGNADASKLEGTYQVVDIDEVDKIIELKLLEGVVPAAAGSKLYYRKSINADMHGLGYIISDGGYYGLGEQNYGVATTGDTKRPKYMKPYIADGTDGGTGGGKFLTEYDFQKALDMQELRGADLTMNMVVTSRSTRASIASTNQGASTGIVRLMRNASATAANDQRSMGYQGVDIKGQTVEVDRFAPTGDVHFLDLSGFNFALEQDLTIDNFDGQTWKQVLTTTDTHGAGTAASLQHKAGRVLAYEANMYAYKELFNTKPRTLAKISLGTTPGRIPANASAVTKQVDYK